MTPRADPNREVLNVGPLEIAPDEAMVWAKGRVLRLTEREFELLTEFARRPDRPITREDLYRLVWREELRPGDRSIDVFVRKLRIKLETALPTWRFIHTHFGGRGYRLTAERVPKTKKRGSDRPATASKGRDLAPQGLK